MINNDLQNATQEAKADRVTRTPLKSGGELKCTVVRKGKQFLLH